MKTISDELLNRILNAGEWNFEGETTPWYWYKGWGYEVTVYEANNYEIYYYDLDDNEEVVELTQRQEVYLISLGLDKYDEEHKEEREQDLKDELQTMLDIENRIYGE